MICLGHVVDEGGKKASKSRGNVLDPNYLFDKFGADAVRFFFCSSTVGENIRTSETYLQEQTRQFFLPLWNVYSFFVTYANVDGFDVNAAEVRSTERPVLDRWLRSRLAGLVEGVDLALERYDVNGAVRPIHSFVDDLSNWYVRRSRRRFWKSESDADKLSAYETLYSTLVTPADETTYSPFGGDDEHLEQEMARARRLVEQGLAARDAARLKVRQPLRVLSVPGDPLSEGIAAIVRDELNVKALVFGAAEVKLDTEIDEELRAEGLAREIVRQANDLRKQAGLRVEDRIELYWDAEDGVLAGALERWTDYVAREVLAVEVTRGRQSAQQEAEAKIEGEPLWIGLKKHS